MMKKKYIVLTSEYGSGARLIGKRLAKDLGIKFYGEEDLLIKAAKESGMDEKVLREYDEKLANVDFNNSTTGDSESGIAAEIFNVYASAILKAVEEGPCILMERGADIVLKDKVDFLNVYTYTSELDKKIERCMRVVGVAEKDAPKFIESQSMQRKLYYQSFSSIERGKMNEYDLCINTDKFDADALEMEKCAAIIKAALL